MQVIRSALCATVLLVALALAACNTDGLGGAGSGPGASSFSSPMSPPVPIAGRWLFSSPGHGQCNMTFGAANAGAAEGTIAPEGGCPGKFYMSRKWSYDQNGLTMRDHNGQTLALLTGEGGRFEGKALSGEPVLLAH